MPGGLKPFPFRWNRNGGFTSLFDAFSSREPVSTSLENALALRFDFQTTRHCERSEAIHVATKKRMDCFAALAMTAKHTFAFPRRVAPELLLDPSPDKGRGATPRGERGMPGARCTRSRACRLDSTRVSHHGRTGIPGIPARGGFTAYFALSLVTGLVCHHRRRKLFPPT
jgi:hypothetical protein